MRTAVFLLAFLLSGCAQTQRRIPSSILDAVLATQLDGAWDQGARLDALRADLLPAAQAAAFPSVKRIAAESSPFNVLVKANARKWLAVKGIKQ